MPGNATKATVQGLKEGKDYEYRIVAKNAGGNSEPSEPSRIQKAKHRFLKPRIDKKNLLNVTVKAGQTATLEAKYVAEPAAEMNWSIENGDEIKESERVKMSIEPTVVRIVIENAKRADTKRYCIKLTNQSGSDSALIDLVVLGAPSRPKGPLEVIGVKKDQVTLKFQKPEDDGGKPIGNYVVEKRDKKTGIWEKVSECVPSSPVTIKGLKEGHEYDFRVMAENQNGLSEPLETDEPVLAKNPYDPPGAPGTPECSNRSKDFIEIAWKAPKKDGGAPIQGYNIERKEKGDKGRWVKINRDLVREPVYQDTKVQPKNEYEYRVAAVNEEGEGDKSQGSVVIPARPLKEKPKFDKLTAPKEIRIKAGEPLKIPLEILGAPTPTVTWSKNGSPVINNVDGIELSNDDDEAKLFKPKAERGDSGKYEVKLANSEGEDSIPINVIVLDKPGKCQGPLVPTETTRSSIGLEWKLPLDDGGSEISGYVVEKCLEGTDKWEKCPGVFIKPAGVVNGLEEGKAYKFRVSPENLFGVGEPLETTAAIVAKLPYDPPSAPSQPEVIDSDINFIQLKWTKPTSDGGNPIQGYMVEAKQEGSSEWVPCNNYPTKGTEFTANNLKEGKSYEFRVKAVNDAGPGEASRPSQAQKAELPIVPTSRMNAPQVDEITKDSVKLTWQKPINDGNAKIEGYVIEKKTPEGEWVEIMEVGPKDLGATVVAPNVAEGEQCQFRVSARNAAGLSEPSLPTEVLTVENQPESPNFGVTKVKDICVKAGQNYEIHVPYKAWPIPTASWMVNDAEKKPEADRIDMPVHENVAAFLNKKAKREDNGDYELTLTNSEGSGRITLRVTVLDHPAAPTGPLVVSNLDAEGCTLSWKPPADNGGSEILNYCVEKREEGTNR